ncbi:hypothetical protein D9615_006824 [Tricholomella constricta]|uniref:Hydrophobin n=1 Tax=Tricholomella constricta TaxID=117010 RepID=A0A8H5H719_9AGAR|nr:hypothetical protein D9615_006824 [Tricholomella constricta]
MNTQFNDTHRSTKPPSFTMFARLSAALLIALPLLVAAGGSQCSSGNQQCCDSVQSSDDANVAALLSSLSIPIQDVNVPIGINCIPVSAFGVAGTSCNTQTVCCENNNFNGVVAIGCTPINVSV